MKQSRILTRREGLKGALLLGLAANIGLATDGAEAQQAPSNGKVLVAYYTRTGNTQVVARQIRRALNANLFAIQTAEPYPEDYEETVSRAQKERDSGFEPPLAAMVPNFDSYKTVFLGFPIWGMSAPSVIRSFLSKHDLSGKTLVPFITHGGYGQGRSMDVVREHAPNTRVLDPFIMEADQERRTLTEVSRWLSGVNIRP